MVYDYNLGWFKAYMINILNNFWMRFHIILNVVFIIIVIQTVIARVMAHYEGITDVSKYFRMASWASIYIFWDIETLRYSWDHIAKLQISYDDILRINTSYLRCFYWEVRKLVLSRFYYCYMKKNLVVFYYNSIV